MIYLIDTNNIFNTHSSTLTKIIKHYTDEIIENISIPDKSSINQLVSIIEPLLYKVTPSDILLAAWAVPAHSKLDELFSTLGQLCYVIVAAGNTNEPIEKYSPSRADNTTCIGCLNKLGVKASLSNFSEMRELTWVCGTNYYVDGVPHNGTSVSAAIYTGMLAEAIRKKNIAHLHNSIKEYHTKVYNEIKGQV